MKHASHLAGCSRSVVLTAALATALGACGGAHGSSAVTAGEPGTSPVLSVDPREAHAEIEALMERTQVDMDTLGATAGDPMTSPVPSTSPSEIPQTCSPPAAPSSTCRDVVDLAHRVCDAASRICELAADLPGDDWAAGRCNAGAASCATAHQRSCDCR